MVNERVDARSGRPQLAATQSFVYRGAVCATAHTGWPRSVDIFFPRAPERWIGQPISRSGIVTCRVVAARPIYALKREFREFGNRDDNVTHDDNTR